MRKFTNTHANRTSFHWRLLASVSAIALLGAGTERALAADSDRPLFWVELDGQFSQQNTDQEIYAPSFLLVSPFDAAAHANLERGASTIWDRGAKISFQPAGSDWVLSLGVRYGKSARSETVNRQTAYASHPSQGVYDAYQIFKAQDAENHTILDFQVGKDVGLGRFGRDAHSVFSAGVRIAQFNSRGAVEIQSQPTNVNEYGYYHIIRANFAAKRRFTGIGPSLSWNASANVAGNSAASSITLDWGLNGAVLFGRQRAQTHHQTTNNYKHYIHYLSVTHTSGGSVRSKNVTVPNFGGFAGVSWRYADAKITFGYRADMFFGAIDGGIDAAKENRGFFGPFASVSVGVGD